MGYREIAIKAGTEHEPFRCQSCAVRSKGVCESVTSEKLILINNMASHKHYRAGQTISSELEPIRFYANIIDGVVKLTKTMEDGRQQIVGLMFAPDFMGGLYAEASPHLMEAVTDVTLCTFPQKAFENILQNTPDLWHRLCEVTLNELDAAREWMLLLGRKTAEEKVATFLYMLARRCMTTGCAQANPDNANSFRLPLSRSEIADYLGLTTETVSRQITHLKVDGTIRLKSSHEFEVPDLADLAAIANIDPPEHA